MGFASTGGRYRQADEAVIAAKKAAELEYKARSEKWTFGLYRNFLVGHDYLFHVVVSRSGKDYTYSFASRNSALPEQAVAFVDWFQCRDTPVFAFGYDTHVTLFSWSHLESVTCKRFMREASV